MPVSRLCACLPGDRLTFADVDARQDYAPFSGQRLHMWAAAAVAHALLCVMSQMHTYNAPMSSCPNNNRLTQPMPLASSSLPSQQSGL